MHYFYNSNLRWINSSFILPFWSPFWDAIAIVFVVTDHCFQVWLTDWLDGPIIKTVANNSVNKGNLVIIPVCFIWLDGKSDKKKNLQSDQEQINDSLANIKFNHICNTKKLNMSVNVWAITMSNLKLLHLWYQISNFSFYLTKWLDYNNHLEASWH